MECGSCGARRGLLVIWHWRPPFTRTTRWPARFGSSTQHVPGAWFARARCIDAAECTARMRKRRDRTQQRGGAIFIRERPCANPPEGACQWCGEPIVLVDPSDYRRANRAMHRGDKHEVGDRKCRSESSDARVWDARDALRIAVKLADRTELACADCGTVVEERVHDAQLNTKLWRRADGAPRWEADHELALEDGGEHVLANLRVRCCPCHRTKTGRENAARARRRREKQTMQLTIGDQ